MVQRPRILFVGEVGDGERLMKVRLQGDCDVVSVHSPMQALAVLSREQFDAVHLSSGLVPQALQLGALLQSGRILDAMPDGAALLDQDNRIIWSNKKFVEWCKQDEVVGRGFYEILKIDEIVGPDVCPFHTARETTSACSSTICSEDNRYYQVHAAPVVDADGSASQLVVTVRDVTTEILQQQKLAAIHQAGLELANLTPDELFNMSVEERIELLKSDILQYTRNLLNFDVVEIRLLNHESRQLVPLLAYGMDEVAEKRDLYARPENNGVTGFVASTGKSYLCENTQADMLYVQGAAGAKSSLTVPLMLQDSVIGTFNVESPLTKGFTESDRQFLEIFSRDVANALNTLELLQAEKSTSAQRSIEAVHAAVALPVDVILNDAVNLMELYMGHEPQVVERIKRILQGARDIKQLIQKVGEGMTPCNARPVGQQTPGRPLLRHKRILVADADPCVREAAHNLLERYHCEVETAHDGEEALRMVRTCRLGACGEYDIIIADIRLPDMSGHQFMLRLQEIMGLIGPPPLLLMTGYGYDPGHSLVKARQAGLEAWAVLYKPFRLDQLLEAVEMVVRKLPPAPADDAPAVVAAVGDESKG